MATGRVIWTGHQLALWGNVVIGGAPATTSTQSSVIHTTLLDVEHLQSRQHNLLSFTLTTVVRGAPAITSQSFVLDTDNCCLRSNGNHINTILCYSHGQLLYVEHLFTLTNVTRPQYRSMYTLPTEGTLSNDGRDVFMTNQP